MSSLVFLASSRAFTAAVSILLNRLLDVSNPRWTFGDGSTEWMVRAATNRGFILSPVDVRLAVYVIGGLCSGSVCFGLGMCRV